MLDTCKIFGLSKPQVYCSCINERKFECMHYLKKGFCEYLTVPSTLRLRLAFNSAHSRVKIKN